MGGLKNTSCILRCWLSNTWSFRQSWFSSFGNSGGTLKSSGVSHPIATVTSETILILSYVGGISWALDRGFTNYPSNSMTEQQLQSRAALWGCNDDSIDFGPGQWNDYLRTGTCWLFTVKLWLWGMTRAKFEVIWRAVGRVWPWMGTGIFL